jgi:hypothetical protein
LALFSEIPRVARDPYFLYELKVLDGLFHAHSHEPVVAHTVIEDYMDPSPSAISVSGFQREAAN